MSPYQGLPPTGEEIDLAVASWHGATGGRSKTIRYYDEKLAAVPQAYRLAITVFYFSLQHVGSYSASSASAAALTIEAWGGPRP